MIFLVAIVAKSQNSSTYTTIGMPYILEYTNSSNTKGGASRPRLPHALYTIYVSGHSIILGNLDSDCEILIYDESEQEELYNCLYISEVSSYIQVPSNLHGSYTIYIIYDGYVLKGKIFFE